jgi:hypothetical protein
MRFDDLGQLPAPLTWWTVPERGGVRWGIARYGLFTGIGPTLAEGFAADEAAAKAAILNAAEKHRPAA